jgi:nucleoid DNA-binding protein
MNKGEVIKMVAAETGNTQEAVRKVVDIIIDLIKATLVSGEEVKLSGFGVFKPVIRKARTARNPKTGEPVEVPEKQTVVFTPSRGYKELINS